MSLQLRSGQALSKAFTELGRSVEWIDNRKT
jgi:hypothetical protein